MIHLLKKICKYFYQKIKYKNLVKFDLSVKIGRKSNFEGMNKLYPECSFNGDLGYGSYIGPKSNLNAKIGRFTSIAPNVNINGGIHPYSYPYVSTSPVFVSLRKQNGCTFTKVQRFDEFRFADKEKRFAVIIGSDCWIGENVFIVGGTTIGDGAVILAGAVVTKDVPAFAIYGGVPAKLIRYRYDEDTIKFLLDFKWWNKDESWFKSNIELMSNIEMLKSIINNNLT
ncbi:CatB-related O-acetyltransferase [Flavobacterium saccharophilum]|uniref:Acetyltransferase (Isoleucine patch superfamily) n=1 Tax=Flavobacterium saccharophilum TaxID=29534 RepID=A0A1M7GUI2_9FLAO|nr:CatB-related O-acetyltransferase [Flavobacterium saccharophilum]SHM19509.1 Acetyltransferase (isoleucine patch superfamily) [Flavobacterium saccharophilum]